MIKLAKRSVEPIGTIQAWEQETDYPDETPFFSDLGWAREGANSRATGWVRGLVVSDPTPPLTSLGAHMLGRQMGRVWMPWALASVADPGVTVFTIDMGAMAPGVVLAGALGGIGGTAVLPLSGVVRLMNPGEVTVDTTRLWEEVGEIHVIAPGLLPRTICVRDPSDSLPTEIDERSAEALAAIADVGLWLNRSQKEVAELCRFSLRASRYWGSGETASPRPSTVRHLYEVHSFVNSLVRTMGRQGARYWLTQPSITGDLRLEVLGHENGTTALLREASADLFAEPPPAERPLPESVHTAESDLHAEPYVPATHLAPPQRPRRAPHPGE